jgi:hypothetical protein
MKKYSQITAAAFLTLAIAGCTIGDHPEVTINVPKPVEPVGIKKPAFGHPIVPPPQENQSEPVSAENSLIKPTDPSTRIIMLSKGRPDPFAQLFAQTDSSETPQAQPIPVPTIPPLPQIKLAKPKPQNVSTKSTERIVIPRNPQNLHHELVLIPKHKPQSKQKPQPPVIVTVLPTKIPPVIPPNKLESILPKPPEPDSARAVIVTGILLVGKEPQAIIKVPNEPSSRYVQAGQLLFNGVLVKRIEMNQGSNPLVVLEQYGIEVAKAVGEKPVTNTKQSTTPA